MPTDAGVGTQVVGIPYRFRTRDVHGGGVETNQGQRILTRKLDTPSTSSRKLAALAGKIVALSPAVLPAALYSRQLFQAMRGELGWDAIFPTTESVKSTAEFWLRNLDSFNGRRWWPRPVELRLEVDALGVGFGGTLSFERASKTAFMGTFTEQQAAQSSTAREMRGYAAAIDSATKRFPDDVRGSSILLIGDNQGAISALNQFRSPLREIHESLDKIFQLCIKYDFDVVARWVPMDTISEADELSRRPDASDWGINHSIYDQTCTWFGVQPTVDIFASDAHHVVDKYVTQFYAPACAAIHALKLNWQELVGQGLAWIFPPTRASSLALSLIQRFRVNALFCAPVQEPGSNEHLQIQSLQGAIVSVPFQIPRSAESCTPSCRVPAGALNPAFLGLKVFMITW
jgi:hypothetical protein